MRDQPVSVLIALGSNLGDRHQEIRRAVRALSSCMRVVRISRPIETAPVDAPAGSPDFLNAVAAGWTRLDAPDLLEALHTIESNRGRIRRIRNEPRRIDLDLILYGSHVKRETRIHLPHPRYLQRSFVMGPLETLRLPWQDPVTGRKLGV